jgi:hypothetical protein
MTEYFAQLSAIIVFVFAAQMNNPLDRTVVINKCEKIASEPHLLLVVLCSSDDIIIIWKGAGYAHSCLGRWTFFFFLNLCLSGDTTNSFP